MHLPHQTESFSSRFVLKFGKTFELTFEYFYPNLDEMTYYMINLCTLFESKVCRHFRFKFEIWCRETERPFTR